MKIIHCALVLSLSTALFPQVASATSGPGCYVVVKVASSDVLNMRSRPNTTSRVVEMLRPRNHGIIAGDGPCRNVGGGRWCRVTHYDGDRTITGWANRKFLRESDCP